MKKILIILTGVFVFILNINAQDVLKSSKGTISFFSHAPLEDIVAESDKLAGAINTKTGAVAVFVKINTLEMENKMQQEHLNEKYLESDKYPKAAFKGVIEGNIIWNKDGEYYVKAKGNLDIHGTSLERVIPITVTIKNGVVSSTSKFKVKVADHKVEIPSLVFKKVAEEVEITLNATFIPYEKK